MCGWKSSCTLRRDATFWPNPAGTRHEIYDTSYLSSHCTPQVRETVSPAVNSTECPCNSMPVDMMSDSIIMQDSDCASSGDENVNLFDDDDSSIDYEHEQDPLLPIDSMHSYSEATSPLLSGQVVTSIAVTNPNMLVSGPIDMHIDDEMSDEHDLLSETVASPVASAIDHIFDELRGCICQGRDHISIDLAKVLPASVITVVPNRTVRRYIWPGKSSKAAWRFSTSRST